MFNVSIIEMFMYMEVTSDDIIHLQYVIFNGNISNVVGKRGRILGVVIFIFNTSFRNFSSIFDCTMYKIGQWGTFNMKQ